MTTRVEEELFCAEEAEKKQIGGVGADWFLLIKRIYKEYIRTYHAAWSGPRTLLLTIRLTKYT